MKRRKKAVSAPRPARACGRDRKQPAVSIVMLCHNDGNYLKGCLDSLRRHTDPARTPYELILVNNASQDGSGPYLRRLARAARVRLIENEQNRFFAGGNNQGIRRARGRSVLLLNADTVVGPQWLERLVACAERDPQAGVVGPYTNGAVGHQLVRETAYRSLDAFPAFASAWALGRQDRSREVHRLIGFCLLIKREVIRRVGLLDERFGPGGYEDYDYCVRARQAGYKILLAEDVFVHHFGGRGYVGMDYDGLRARNRTILADKWCRHIVETLDDIDAALAN